MDRIVKGKNVMGGDSSRRAEIEQPARREMVCYRGSPGRKVFGNEGFHLSRELLSHQSGCEWGSGYRWIPDRKAGTGRLPKINSRFNTFTSQQRSERIRLRRHQLGWPRGKTQFISKLPGPDNKDWTPVLS